MVMAVEPSECSNAPATDVVVTENQRGRELGPMSSSAWDDVTAAG